MTGFISRQSKRAVGGASSSLGLINGGISRVLAATMTMSNQTRIHLSNDHIRPEMPIGAKMDEAANT